MILDTTSKTVEVILGAAKTTNDCEVNADFADTVSGSTFVPASTPSLTNGLTAVTVVAAPAASTQRHVKALSVYNADTVNQTVTVRTYDGTNRRRIISAALAPGACLVYTDHSGWQIIQANPGQIIGTSTNDNAAAGCVGEYQESEVPIGSEFSITTGVTFDVTHLSLTPGDWNVWGTIAFDNGSGATVFSSMIGWVNSTSVSQPSSSGKGGLIRLTYSMTGNEVIAPVGQRRFSLSATTNVYLSGVSNFTNTAAAHGIICARRAR